MSVVFHSAGDPGATRCSGSATAIDKAPRPASPACAAAAFALLEFALRSGDVSTVALCCCDEAATYLRDDLADTFSALDAVRHGRAHLDLHEQADRDAELFLRAAALLLGDAA